jgi:two-component system chemotaxis sensor kinase CheA
MEQFKTKFIEEALDLIQDLEKSSLELSADPLNKKHIEVIFRAMHSLKGGSAMFGFNKIDAFTHQLEAAYDMVRAGKLKVTDQLLDLTFKSIDHIKVLLSDDDNLSKEALRNHEFLLKEIREIINVEKKSDEKTIAQDNSIAEKVDDKLTTKHYYIQFIPKPDIFKNGTNPILIVNELAGIGSAKVYTFTSEIPELDKLNVLKCYTHWVTILSTLSTIDEIRDVFIFVDLDCELVIKELEVGNYIDNGSLFQMLDNSFSNGEKLELEAIERWITETSKPVSSGTEQTNSDTNYKKTEQSISSIRVSSDKLDELINLVSELVTRQAGLSLISESINNKDLITIAEDIEKISRRLRDNTFGIRLIPVENMVTRFQRLVRELSHELNKEITFQTEGTETELDKSIIEGLIDPLMHIIRNSIDHGIESAEERKKNGKTAKGKILLKAFYSGANVYIQVSDDGKGIDTRGVYKHALKKGLIKEDVELSEKELLNLIFLPGFTTAENITKVSGRGVGMDVVKRKISDLRGEVTLQTKKNEGTTITIKLPLTLSIIDGLLVKINQIFYVIPLATVSKCFEFRHDQLINAVNNLIFVNDGHIPFAYLRKEFNIETVSPAIEQIVVIEYGETRFGLAVDEVIGEYQAVLKSLGTMFRMQDVISGATILGDGTVALVMDPAKIISQFTYVAEESYNLH